MVTCLRYASGVRATLSLHYLHDLTDYEETVLYLGRADRVRLVFPSPFFRNMPTEVFVEGMEDGRPFEKRVPVSMKEACVATGRQPETSPAEARGDVALLHRIFAAIKRPLQG